MDSSCASSGTASIAVRLPQELIDAIIDHLHDDHKSLSSCSLVALHWRKSVRWHLFHTLFVNFWDRSCAALLSFLTDSLHTIALLIKELSLDGEHDERAYPGPLLRASLDTSQLHTIISLLPSLKALQLLTLTWDPLKCDYYAPPIITSLKALVIRRVVFMGGSGAIQTDIVQANVFGLFASFPNINILYLECSELANKQFDTLDELSGGDRIRRLRLPPYLCLQELHLVAFDLWTLRLIQRSSFLSGIKNLYIEEETPETNPVVQAILHMGATISALRIDLTYGDAWFHLNLMVDADCVCFPDFHLYDLPRCTALEQIALDVDQEIEDGAQFTLVLDTLSTLRPQVRSITIYLALATCLQLSEYTLGSHLNWERLETTLDNLGNLNEITLTLTIYRQLIVAPVDLKSLINGLKIRRVFEERLSKVYRKGILSVLIPDIPETWTLDGFIDEIGGEPGLEHEGWIVQSGASGDTDNVGE